MHPGHVSDDCTCHHWSATIGNHFHIIQENLTIGGYQMMIERIEVFYRILPYGDPIGLW